MSTVWKKVVAIYSIKRKKRMERIHFRHFNENVYDASKMQTSRQFVIVGKSFRKRRHLSICTVGEHMWKNGLFAELWVRVRFAWNPQNLTQKSEGEGGCKKFYGWNLCWSESVREKVKSYPRVSYVITRKNQYVVQIEKVFFQREHFFQRKWNRRDDMCTFHISFSFW